MPKIRTGAAIATAFALTLPALAVAAVVAWLYRTILIGGLVGSGNVLDWATAGWFTRLLSIVAPNVLAGYVTSALAIYWTSRLFRRAGYMSVAYSLTTLSTVLGAVAVIAAMGRGDATQAAVIACHTVGYVIGLFATARMVIEDGAHDLRPDTRPA